MNKTRLGGFALALSLLTSLAAADTLELRNGSLLQGNYMGGTQTTVRFEVAGQMMTLPVTDILALTFGGPAPQASTQTPTGQTAQPAGTAQTGQPVAGAAPVAQPGTNTPAPIMVPAGTPLLVRMRDTVDSNKDKAGKRFTAVLEAPITVGGQIVVPQGAQVYGQLASSNSAGRIVGKSELSLELTDVMVNGIRQPVVSGEYAVKGDSQAKNTGGKVVGGAVIGGLIGGKKGRKKGAKVGVGASVLTRGSQVSVPSGTLLEFRLRAPMSL